MNHKRHLPRWGQKEVRGKVWKTDLRASEPKYNTKAEFGMRTNNTSLTALPGCCSRQRSSKTASLLGGGTPGVLQHPARFSRNCVPNASLPSHFPRGTRFLKQKAREGGGLGRGGGLRKRGKRLPCLKPKLVEALVQPFLFLFNFICF